jgi:hypothetical protein
MVVATHLPPEHVPVLSRGKHRNPRKGACFMEFASYLAGERWSDHPDCTHPLLAALARGVNDHMSDEGRQQLAPLIPSVIGLTSDDLHVDVRIALLCARTALPVVAAEQQRVMAVAVVSCERALAHLDNDRTSGWDDASRRVLEQAPHAVEWARRFTSELGPSIKRFRRIAAPSIVSNAVKGIADACVPDPDAMLRGLLVDAIRECRRWASPPVDTTTSVDVGTPRDAAASR